jgi:hypothetical protein
MGAPLMHTNVRGEGRGKGRGGEVGKVGRMQRDGCKILMLSAWLLMSCLVWKVFFYSQYLLKTISFLQFALGVKRQMDVWDKEGRKGKNRSDNIKFSTDLPQMLVQVAPEAGQPMYTIFPRHVSTEEHF